MPSDRVLAIDHDAAVPPSVQIFEQLRAMIERGELRAGDTLPTVRQLAGDLGIAPNTVVRAYADLKADGFVESESRRVTRVARGAAKLGSKRRAALTDAVSAFLASLASRGYAPDEIAVELRKRLAV